MNYFAVTGMTAVSLYRTLRTNNATFQSRKNINSLHRPTLYETRHLSQVFHLRQNEFDILLFNHQWQKSSDSIKISTISSEYARHFVYAKTEREPFTPQELVLPSSELLLCMLARNLSFYELLLLSLEFSGSYSLKHDEPKLISNCRPILSAKKLGDFVSNIKNRRWCGMKKLKSFVQILQEGSASPMESLLYSLLAMPTRLGGLGIKELKLNYKIDLSPEAQLIAGQPYVVVDIFHPKSKTAIEYDSRDFHSEADQSQKDKRRQEALKKDGLKTISIVPQQILDYKIFKVCSVEILKAIKGRARVRVKNYESKQRHCHAQLVMAARKLTP